METLLPLEPNADVCTIFQRHGCRKYGAEKDRRNNPPSCECGVGESASLYRRRKDSCMVHTSFHTGNRSSSTTGSEARSLELAFSLGLYLQPPGLLMSNANTSWIMAWKVNSCRSGVQGSPIRSRIKIVPLLYFASVELPIVAERRGNRTTTLTMSTIKNWCGKRRKAGAG